MNNKVIKIVSVLIAVTVVAYGFVVAGRIDDDLNPELNKVSNSMESKKVVETEEITPSTQKYVIKNSTVIPVDPTNHKKVLLLTIDDGPSVRTPEIMKILEAHNAKAIFFINGINCKNNPEIIKEISQQGFAVGNHTWSHLNLKKQTDLSIIKSQIDKDSELIRKETGHDPLFFRPPYGASNTYIRDLVKSEGMIFMNWTGSALDWEKGSSEKDIFVSNVMNNLYSGSIILIHEHPWSVANLDSLLTTLENSGYTYVDPADIIEE